MRKTVLTILAAIMSIAMTVPAYADAAATEVITFGGGTGNSQTEDKNKPYLALGQDLTQDQLAAVLSAMGLSGTDLSEYNVVYVTNPEEHQYLDQYISPAVIGTKSLSSVLVKPAESGHGITVNTYNINYCTTGMYKNALLTAGVKDADIIVAGPSSISGTAGTWGNLST